MVPVVSTTFAALDKLFAGLGRESLGWLFVDEAGQAPPQYAVSALWRARRAVIVGDPLQLKPVVTLPWEGQRALLRDFGSVSSGRRAAHPCSRSPTGSPSTERRYQARLATSRFGSARRCECTGDVTDPCSTSATRLPMTA